MAFRADELKQIEKAVPTFMKKRRPPSHIRSEIDLDVRTYRQSVEVVEVRPRWRSPGEMTETPVAKATFVRSQFVRSQNVWKVFWQRADLKWHAYSPAPTTGSVEEFLAVVDRDECHCFFG